MTKEKLTALIADAKDCETLDEYIRECAPTLPAAYADDLTKATSVLEDIWQCRDSLEFRPIYQLSKLTQAGFCQKYDIPSRTLEYWLSKGRTPPPYLLELLLADVLTDKYEDEFN